MKFFNVFSSFSAKKKVINWENVIIHASLQKDSIKYKTNWVMESSSERKKKVEFNMLVNNLPLHDKVFFFKYFCMSPTGFE